MDTYLPDSSGINSLGGFSFQIRVFAYYMSMLINKDMQIEFETIDDVNLKKIKADEIDNNNENFISKLVNGNSNIAIQVKRTSISESVAMKVILNWILLEASKNEVEKYVLFTDQQYDNVDILFNKTATELYEVVQKSDKSAKAIITKVKKKFKDNFSGFEKIYNAINEKHKFVSIDNIDKEIANRYSMLFRKGGINTIVYYQRIKELLQCVTVEIMEAVNRKKPYILNFSQYMKLIEEITERITEKVMQPLYSDFKKIYRIDFKDLKIANSREYKQLIACKLPEILIKQHLGFGAYYGNLRLMYMESNKLSKIKNIEETTYENFETTKYDLQRNGKDEPYNRLKETKKMDNSYADNEQIRYGSGIYLTKEGIKDIQVSWEDAENEKSGS